MDLGFLDLRPTGDGTYEASNLDEGLGSVVFGGQLLAQAVVAAARTVPDKAVLNLHCVFARSASVSAPLDVTVETMQAGRAFASVAVSAAQGGKLCARSIVLLHAPDPDLIRHADPAPPVSAPGDLPGRDGWWDIRFDGGVDISDAGAAGPPELRVWTRFPDVPAGSPPEVHQALLAYASDGFLIGTAMLPHEGYSQAMAHVSISTTVLAQTISFHEPFDASRWLLLDHRSSYAGHGRTQGAASVFDEGGRLVASYSQVNMVRDFPAGQAPAAGERAKH